MNQDIPDIPAIFFPEPLRLGTASWPEYKHAVETACELTGVSANLASSPARGPALLAVDKADWQRQDELCKAIITLNIKNFPRFHIPAGRDVPARAVWARLVAIHSPSWCQQLTVLVLAALLVLVFALGAWSLLGWMRSSPPRVVHMRDPMCGTLTCARYPAYCAHLGC